MTNFTIDFVDSFSDDIEVSLTSLEPDTKFAFAEKHFVEYMKSENEYFIDWLAFTLGLPLNLDEASYLRLHIAFLGEFKVYQTNLLMLKKQQIKQQKKSIVLTKIKLQYLKVQTKVLLFIANIVNPEDDFIIKMREDADNKKLLKNFK